MEEEQMNDLLEVDWVQASLVQLKVNASVVSFE